MLFNIYSFSSLNENWNHTVEKTYFTSEYNLLKQKCLMLCSITKVYISEWHGSSGAWIMAGKKISKEDREDLNVFQRTIVHGA